MMFLRTCLFFVAISQALCAFDPVAFTVGQDEHVDRTQLHANADIPFNVITTSHGSPRLSTGAFTCTKAGMYKFQAYSLTKAGSNVWLELFHNQALVASLWGHTTNDYAAAGNVVILQLKTGDKVEVKVRDNYEVSIYGASDQIYTTFTGVQLGSLESAAEQSHLSAFSVTLNQNETVAAGAKVLFNTILTDTNSQYDQTTGIYTAPTGGLYVFHFFSLTKNNEEEWLELFKNTDFVCSIYSKTNAEWADAGNTVLLHLSTGDQVSVQSHKNETRPSFLFGAADQVYTTFTGAQIATDKDIAAGSGFFGFSVGMSNHYTATANQTVHFDHVFYDTENAYDPLHGTFIAPEAGLYEFNYHALGRNQSAIWLELFHNDVYINSLYGHLPDHYATAGNAAVLDLHIGDTVSVVAHDTQELYGNAGEIYCTFTGYMLEKVAAGPIVGK